ncbi:MAG: glutamine hydrolyzing CTP synthase [Candidatus Micrarchaeia archaeon]
MPTKYIVVLGSLLSGIGKGVVSASIAKILTLYNYNVMPMKFDGYLNYDCGTINPFKHGEVFVLEDGGEVDMDFGTYERFINKNILSDFSLTGGKLFSGIIKKERRGDYLGSDVQIIPHLTNLIIENLKELSKKNNLDILIIEVGGTIGDLENGYFIEAMRQLSLKEKVVFIDVTYIPELKKVGEQKTKPTQLALRKLMELGINPNYIVCRSENPLNKSIKQKIAFFANIDENAVIDNHDIDNIYEVPLKFLEQNFDKLLLNDLGLNNNAINEKYLYDWKEIVNKSKKDKNKKDINIAVVGKYINLKDSYASVKEALVHSANKLNINLNIGWIESEEFEGENYKDRLSALNEYDGILVPGGFGSRGINGMINAIEYARVNKKPYLGLCLGMQLMTIEYARNVCGLTDANSSEFNENAKYKVIDLMSEQKNIVNKGATMRLGAWEALIKEGTATYDAYKTNKVYERHRHRYEFNNEYRELFAEKGLIISGTTIDGNLVEFIEWKDSFGIGTQAHPEFKSRPENPSPLFVKFLNETIKNKIKE